MSLSYHFSFQILFYFSNPRLLLLPPDFSLPPLAAVPLSAPAAATSSLLALVLLRPPDPVAPSPLAGAVVQDRAERRTAATGLLGAKAIV